MITLVFRGGCCCCCCRFWARSLENLDEGLFCCETGFGQFWPIRGAAASMALKKASSRAVDSEADTGDCTAPRATCSRNGRAPKILNDDAFLFA